MSSPNPSNDAQREMEQRALRNVRGLVDKMETIEAIDNRAQRRMVTWIFAGALALVLVIVGYGIYQATKSTSAKPVVITPDKLPPIRPGPPAK